MVLDVQGVVFPLLALSWLWRLPFPWDGIGANWQSLNCMVPGCGFVPINYAVFAAAQLVLLKLAMRRGLDREDSSGVSDGETEPLLGD